MRVHRECAFEEDRGRPIIVRNRKPEILVIDDDPAYLESVKVSLSDRYRLSCFTSPDQAGEKLKTVDLVMLDLNLGRSNGLDVYRRWKQRRPELKYVICSGQSDVEKAIFCLKEGAADYLVKPFQKDHLRTKVDDWLAPIRNHIHEDDLGWFFRSSNGQIKELADKIEKLGKHPDLNVLILGESGTGKEIIAKSLHQAVGNVSRSFVPVNLVATPSTLLESDLFGTEEGAYTGARRRKGKLERADGGDLFLDEVAELSLGAQVKLLRVLQDKTLERLGGTFQRKLQFRILSATNRPLGEMVSKRQFREDFVYRLADVVLHLPPLRERTEDLLRLAQFFINRHSYQEGKLELGDPAKEFLLSYDWPGNLRQLESTIKKAVAFSTGPMLNFLEPFDPYLLGTSTAEKSSACERSRYLVALHKNRGDKLRARQALNVSKSTFYRKLKELRIDGH